MKLAVNRPKRQPGKCSRGNCNSTPRRSAAAATKPNKLELKQTEGKKMTGRGIRGRGMGKEQPLQMMTLPLIPLPILLQCVLFFRGKPI
jgi:hypothetical protein